MTQAQLDQARTYLRAAYRVMEPMASPRGNDTILREAARNLDLAARSIRDNTTG